MKKTLAIILAVLTLCLTLSAVSCGNTGSAEVSTEAVSTTAVLEEVSTEAVETEPQFTIIDCKGEDFTIYMRNSTATSYASLYINGEDNGDIMDSAAFKRNAIVEDKFNLNFKTIEVSAPQDTVLVDIQSGNVTYDLILGQRNGVAKKAATGALFDFNELGLDFNNPWWDINCYNGYQISGHNYVMTNDISVGRFTGAQFFYFNKELVKQYNLTDPYELVKSNQWTLDNYLAMVKSVSDVRADGSIGTYGMLSLGGQYNGNHIHMLGGCGVKYTTLDADGTVVLQVSEQIEKIDTIFNKIKAVFGDPNYVINYTTADSMDPDAAGNYANIYMHGRALFAAGHFLFFQGGMGVSAELTDMQDDYGVVPNPKYDSDQKNYYHKVDMYSVIFAIPNAPDQVDMNRLAAVTDYMAYQSMKTVIPAYYEITIKTKRVSDPTASEMIDIVRANILYEMSDIFGIGVSGNLDSGYTINSVSSIWKSAEKSVKQKLADLTKSIEALE